MATLDGVDPRLVDGFNKLAGVCDISVSSGSRPDAYVTGPGDGSQQDLYDRWKNHEPGIYMPATPKVYGGNGSPHTAGIAIDVDGDLACAQREAPKFGLVFPFGDGAGGGADPPHMQFAGGDDYQMTFTEQNSDAPAPPPAPARDPLPAILAGVTAALTHKPGDTSMAGLQGFRQALTVGETKAPEPAAPAAAAGEAGAGTPAGGSGGAWGDYARAVLTGLGAPITQDNVDFMLTWFKHEQPPNSPNGAFNPLNMQNSNTHQFSYGSFDEGVAATVSNLLNQGSYGGIVDALRQGNNAHGALGALANSPWAESRYDPDWQSHDLATRAAIGAQRLIASYGETQANRGGLEAGRLF